MTNINLIMKVTSKCTMACSYCQYMANLTDNSNLIMSREILQKSISQLMALPSSNLTFIWHGGEPLLVGMDFYEEAIYFQTQHRRKNTQKIVNNIQTNATLLNEKWIDFLQKNNFNISISLDGPDEIHNMHRVYPSGTSSFTHIMQAVKLLMDNKSKFGLLAVITKESIKKPKEIYNFFINNGFKSFDFLPCTETNKYTGEMIGASITASEFENFMIQVFDLWIKDDNPDIRVRYFDNILKGILGGKPTLCKFAGTCSNFITIDCNGDIYPCDNFVGFTDLKFGNILSDDLQVVIGNDRYKNFVKKINVIKPKCSNCEWYQICQGGCPYYRYMLGQDFTNDNYFCEARKNIFKHIENRVKRIINDA